MRTKLLILFSLGCFMAYAGEPIPGLPFFEDFESASVIPASWTLINVDGNTPDDAELANMKDSAWVVTNSPVMGSNVAMGVSFYSPEGGADDWLILPRIMLTGNAVLTWDALSLTSSGSYPDSYEVLVSTTDLQTTSFTKIFSVTDEAWRESAGGTGVQRRSIALDTLGYANQEVYIAFRLMTPDPGGDRLAIDNIRLEELLDEGFENGIPESWVVVDRGFNPGTWGGDNYDPHKGDKHISIDTYDSEEPSAADDWLITPQITVGENFAVTFWAKSDDADYLDDLSVLISKTDTATASFTLVLEEISGVPNEYTKYVYLLDNVPELNPGDKIYIGFRCNSNGSWLFMDDVRIGKLIPPVISKAYATSGAALTVEFDGELDAVQSQGFKLGGSANVTFGVAEISSEDARVVKLSDVSAAMVGDNLLDTLYYEPLGTSYAFYTGLMPLSYGNLTNPEGTIDFDDHTATWQGVVTAVDSYDTSRVWIQDGAGAHHGLNTYDMAGGPVNLGDVVLVLAKLSPYKKLAELYPATLIDILSTGNELQTAVIKGSDISIDNAPDADPAEKYEAALVTINDVMVDSWDGVYFTCTDDNGETYFYVGDGIDLLAEFGEDLEPLMAIGSTYNITGIVVGRDGEYRLAPRSTDDIEMLSGLEQSDKSGIRIFPNPSSGSLFVENLSGIRRIEITNLIGRMVYQQEVNGKEKLVIDVSGLEHGTYLVKLTGHDDQESITKVVVR